MIKKTKQPSIQDQLLKGVSNEEGGVLAKLWRNMLLDTNNIGRVAKMIQDYDNRPHSSSIEAVKRKSKYSMERYATSDNLMWKIFLDLSFQLMLVKKMTITTTLTHSSGATSLHHVTFDKDDKGVLSKLWKVILEDPNIKKSVAEMIDGYVSRTQKTGSSTKNKSKYSMEKNAGSDDMTWKIFVDLVFQLLRVVKVSLAISLVHKNDSTSNHSVVFDNGSDSNFEDNTTYYQLGNKRNKKNGK